MRLPQGNVERRSSAPPHFLSAGQMNRLLQNLTTAALVVLLVLTLPAQAGNTRATFGVSVTVNPVARINHESPDHIVITDLDIQRGFVDVESNSAIQVSSNSTAGFALDIYSVSNIFNNVVINGVDGEVRLNAEGGSIVHRWSHAQTQSMLLSYRFVLRPDIQPGTYSFPLQMAVRPL
jgi:hypothetical protein